MTRQPQPFELNKAVRLVFERVTEVRERQSFAAPVSLGISGIDCSGKSTLAEALLAAACDSDMRTTLVQADDFIIPRGARKRGSPPHIDYFENTFNHKEFAERVAAARESGNADLVIGEGVFVFRRELVSLWDFKVWIEMGAGESVERGAARDAGYFGSAEKARGEYERRFVPAHRYHVERDRPVNSADMVFEVKIDGP